MKFLRCPAAFVAACLAANTLLAAVPVEMKIRWPAGKRLVRHVETTQDVKVSGESLPAPLEQNSLQARDYSLTVTGPREIELEIRGLKISNTSQGKTMVFDSRTAPKQGEDGFFPLLRRVVGARARCLIGEDGRIEQVADYPEWIGRVTAGAPANNTVALTNMFSEENLKQLGATPSGLPAQPVKIGEHWTTEREQRLAGGVTLVTKLRYTFTGMADRDGRKCAVWEHSGTITSKPAPAGSARTTKVESSKVTGKTWFDPGLGVVVEGTVTQEMTLVSTGPEGSVTNEFRTKITNRLVELADAPKP